MNEQTQKYLRIGAGVAAVVVCAVVLWLLFRDIRSGSDVDQRVDDRLEQTQEQQHAAESSLDSAIERAADSAGTAGELQDGIDRSQSIANDIGAADDSAREGTDRAKTAIDAAGESVDRAAGIAAECQKLSESSESIFAKYDSGYQSGASATR